MLCDIFPLLSVHMSDGWLKEASQLRFSQNEHQIDHCNLAGHAKASQIGKELLCTGLGNSHILIQQLKYKRAR